MNFLLWYNQKWLLYTNLNMLKKCLSRYAMIVFMTTEIGVPSFDFQIVQGNQLNLKQSWEGSKLSSSLIFKSKNHIVRNSFWIKKNRASDNEGKFHIFLKCRIWICNKKKSIFPWTSELAWIWHFLRKLDYFWALLYWQHWLQNWASVFCNQCRQYKSAQK